MGKPRLERRRQRRMDLACLAVISGGSEQVPLEARTLNISDSGAMLSVPAGSPPQVDQAIKVCLSIPRTTLNTHMVEQMETPARVVRHQPTADDGVVGVAIQFSQSRDLGLYV